MSEAKGLEEVPEISVPDLEPDAFRELLRFIYSGLNHCVDELDSTVDC